MSGFLFDSTARGKELDSYMRKALTGDCDNQASPTVLVTDMRVPMTGYRLGCEFMVLPSKRSARWLLPLGPRACSASSLQLVNGTSYRSRLAKMVLSVALGIGIVQPFLRHRVRVLIRANIPRERLKELFLHESLKDALGRDDVTAALSLGTPGAYRKVTIQVMDISGRILAYAKLAESPGAIRALNHERVILQQLELFPQLAESFPRVLSTFHLGHAQGLVVGTGPARPGPLAFVSSHKDFLKRLFTTTQQDSCLHESPMSATIAATYAQVKNKLASQWLDRLAWALELLQTGLGRETLPLGVAHRDFTPWNTRQHPSGSLFVFDWEVAAWGYPPMYDVFHFGLMVSTLVKSKLPAWERYRRDWESIISSLYALPQSYLGELYLAYLTDMSLFYLAARLEAPSQGDDRFVDVLGKEFDYIHAASQRKIGGRYGLA